MEEKKVVGNPFQRLKHLIKDPVKNPDEAVERIKKFGFITLGCLATACLVIALNSRVASVPILAKLWVIIGFFAVVSFIIGVIILLLMIRVLIHLKKKFANLDCPQCHTQIAYSDDVVILKDVRRLLISTSRTENNRAGIDLKVTGTEYAALTVRCKCQKCGAIKQFEVELKTLECSKKENCSALAVGARQNQFENDLRYEQQNGFDGSRGYSYRFRYSDINKLLEEYFGDHFIIR